MASIQLLVGQTDWQVECPDTKQIALQRRIEPTAIRDVTEAVRNALDHPLRFEPLRRALTPDDHITLVVDDRLPCLTNLLVPILEHLSSAGVDYQNITLLSPPPGNRQGWLDDLPDEFQDVRTEIHDPNNKQRLSYVASTRSGQRLYMNRTLVEADQVIVLTRRCFDPLLGYSGCEGALYPTFGDVENRNHSLKFLSLELPDTKPNRLREEAVEACWLLGAPFFIQVIEGPGDTIAHVQAGLVETSTDGQKALDDRWWSSCEQRPDLVVALVSGDPSRHDFSDLAAAINTASRVVRVGGSIAVVTNIDAPIGEAASILRRCDQADEAARELLQKKPGELPAAFQIASAAQNAHLYVCSGYEDDLIEELFSTPFRSVRELQRLIDSAGSCLFIPDANKSVVGCI